MKIIFKIYLMLGLILGHSAQASKTNLTLDLKKSSLKWSGKFTAMPVKASMKFKSGQFVKDHKKLVSGTLVGDLKSLTSDSELLDEQLKGPLLLNVEQYPTAELKIKTFSELLPFAPGGPNGHMSGVLYFQGKTHPVESDFIVDPAMKSADSIHLMGKLKTQSTKMLDGTLEYEIWAKK